MSAPLIRVRTYVVVFLALVLLTAATVAAATLDLGALHAPVALGIAGAKAALVILYFMHLRWSESLVRVFLLGGILWLAFLVGLSVLDSMARAA